MPSDRHSVPQLHERQEKLNSTAVTVNLRPLKTFALEKLPDSSLRDILVAEAHDELDVAAFLARLPIYLRLSKRIKL